MLRLTEIVNYLKSKGGRPGKTVLYNEVNETTSLDEFRLIFAAFYGDLFMLQALFNIGIGLDGQDYDARTALHLASSEGKIEAVKFLVENGANIYIKDSRGSDPLDDAMRENRIHVVNYFVSILSSRRNSSCHSFENGFFNKGIQ
jgi:ankyrin repeat protein